MLPVNQVLVGNCIEVMRGFPAESIDMVMFSPPYYGLRDYGKRTETIWGGQPNCVHEWIEERMTLVHENRNFTSGTQEEVHGKKGTTFIKKYDDKRAGFCVTCGAWKGQLGLEPTWQMYVDHMVKISREIKRVLKRTGSMFIVMGDTYAGSHCGKGDKTLFQNYRRTKVAGNLYEKPSPQAKAIDYKPKCLMGIPWRVAFALIEAGWVIRNDIIWHKPNAMPSSVKDRLTQTYEHIFHFVRGRKYYHDLDAIREPHKTASKEEVKNYVYPESGRMRRLIQRLYKIAKQMRGQSCYKGKNADLQGWKEVCSNAKAYRDALKVLEQKEKLTDEERKFLQDYTQNHLGHPLGKNPGDVTSERVKANVEHFVPRGSGGHYAYGGLDSKQGKHEHPLGKNPGDVALTKHDLAINRVGNFSYTDPLHVKAYNIKGKNPGDSIKIGMHHGSSLTSGRATHYEGQVIESHPSGSNPGDFWSINTKPFRGAHFAVYPEEICEKPIKASCPELVCSKCGLPKVSHPRWCPSCNCNNPVYRPGIVLDPMCGSGTTLAAAKRLGRKYIGIDINSKYVSIAVERLLKIGSLDHWVSG